ncbi:site-specific integrase [Sphingobium bisphenolivorans]|uniref:site-specific integrase n=1 Tax=Sphingobium bisphenolivorans TaxID=1335760 RepID=UPI001EE76479|nr:site-specific integrase [Sphingobium bisphenolivorans]
MAKLTRTKTGLWTARKVIPKDVRAAYGKREDKPTWPASLTQGQARAEFGAWLVAVEERVAALRSTHAGPAVDLTQRQSRALAGKWYRDMCQRHEDSPGDELGWEMGLEDLYPKETEQSYQESLRGNSEPYEGPWRITPMLENEMRWLLDKEDLRITPPAADRLLQDMADLYIAFSHLMIRRCRGDYGADKLIDKLPNWEPAAPEAKVPAVSGPTITSLFDGYVAERDPAEATVKAWKRMIQHLIAFLGHDDAARVTPEDIINWKDRLLTEPTKTGKQRSAKTVRETYLAAAKAVFGWAKENRKVDVDPTPGVTVRGGKRQRLRDPGFTNAEALTILRATVKAPEGRLSHHHSVARRWVPWLCAYSGARVNEVTQLRKQDIICQDGVWAMNITPEAGSVKNNTARMVPLHSHLIDQGFLKFVEGSAAGPLFYNPSGHRGGSAGNPHYKKVGERLAAWVRSLGITDENVAPNHGWRHRFKTVARGARMDPEARAVIPGHAPKTEGESYGTWPLDELAAEIEKLPRIDVNDG